MFWQLTIDANDQVLLARFWTRALGYQPVPPNEPDTTWHAHYRSQLAGRTGFDDRNFRPGWAATADLVSAGAEPKVGKNRLHLDLYPTGQDNASPMQQRIEIVEAKLLSWSIWAPGCSAGPDMTTRTTRSTSSSCTIRKATNSVSVEMHGGRTPRARETAATPGLKGCQAPSPSRARRMSRQASAHAVKFPHANRARVHIPRHAS